MRRLFIALSLLAALISTQTDAHPLKQGPLFDFYPGDAATDAGIAALSSTMTVNSQTLTPVFRYFGSDAVGGDSATWIEHDARAGGDMAKVEGGANITSGRDVPTLHASDSAMQFNNADWMATSGSFADITTEDLVVEAYVWRNTGTGNSDIFSKAVNVSSAGWWVTSTNNSFSFGMYDGADAASTSNSITNGAWGHLLCFVDRDVASANGAICYLNGVVGTGANPTAVGSLTNAAPARLGGLVAWAASADAIAYLAAWKCTDCLANADLTEEAALAKSRFYALTGVVADVGAGSTAVNSYARASPAMLQKYSGGVSSLHYVGNGWPRVVSNSVTTGYLGELSVQNKVLQSEALGTSWTELNAPDGLTSNAALSDPITDNADSFDSIIADATNTVHGYSQAVTVTATVTTFSVLAKAGANTWAYLSDDTVANATGYFDLSACDESGTAGAGVIDEFAENYGNGWCRIGISFTGTAAAHTFKLACAQADGDNTIATGDGATTTCSFGGAQVVAFQYPMSYVPTTTGMVTRSTDVLSWASSGNINTASGSAVISAILPAHTQTRKHAIAVVRGAGGECVDFITDTTGAVQINVTDNSVVVGTSTSTTTIATDAASTPFFLWRPEHVRVGLNGAVEGSPDTSWTLPTLTTLHVADSGCDGDSLVRSVLVNRWRIFQSPEVYR